MATAATGLLPAFPDQPQSQQNSTATAAYYSQGSIGAGGAFAVPTTSSSSTQQSSSASGSATTPQQQMYYLPQQQQQKQQSAASQSQRALLQNQYQHPHPTSTPSYRSTMESGGGQAGMMTPMSGSGGGSLVNTPMSGQGLGMGVDMGMSMGMGGIGLGMGGAGAGTGEPSMIGSGQATVYITSYNGISVYESMIRNVAVMMRRSDSWLNATQILKVAGIGKAQREKIADMELSLGPHEKVLGGYGKYQGTWVPFEIAMALSQQYHVHTLLAPLFATQNNSSARITAGGPIASQSHGQEALVTPVKKLASPPAMGMTVGTGTGMGKRSSQSQSRRSGSGGEGSSPFASKVYTGAELGSGSASTSTAISNTAGAGATTQMYSAPSGSAVPAGTSGKRARSVSSQAGVGGEPVSKRSRGGETGPDGHLEAAFLPTVTEGDDEKPASDLDADADGDLDVDMDGDRDMERNQVVSLGTPGSDVDRFAMPPNTTLATKASRPQMTVPFGVVKAEEAAKSRARVKLLSLFQVAEGEEVDLDSLLQPDLKSSPSALDPLSSNEPIDIDQVIDDKGHTALHWATALARQHLISGLIMRGADIHRGNFSGETALMRSVLTTNNADGSTFGDLLSKYLGSSLRTLDFSHRTVLHHIALIASVKGRPASANAYMSTLLEWMTAVEDRISMQAFVNIQDVHGDTALIIAARVGNKNLVKLLMDAGADKTLANDLGLRPVDFGIDVKGLDCVSGIISAPASQTSSDRPMRKGESIIRHITDMVQQLNDDFAREMAEKQEYLERLQGEVKSATRDLAFERRSLKAAQQKAAKLEESRQRVANLERALKDEASYSFGATSSSTMEPAAGDVDPPIIDIKSLGSAGSQIIHLRRVTNWQERAMSFLQARVHSMEGAEAERAVQYKRVIAKCVKITVDQVDARLESLTAAVESDGLALDVGKASAFMQRVASVGA